MNGSRAWMLPLTGIVFILLFIVGLVVDGAGLWILIVSVTLLIGERKGATPVVE